MTNTKQHQITSTESRALERSCKSLISQILTEYSNTAYMRITGQNNLDSVPDTISELWISSDHPSVAFIKRPTPSTNLTQLNDELMWLSDRLATAFADLD